MNLRAVLPLASFALAASLARAQVPPPAPPAPAPPSGIARSVTVTGAGKASARPDQATITLGVETKADSAAAALDANSRKMAALVKTLRDAGIPAEDVQTSQLSIQPLWDFTKDRRVLGGYLAQNQVTVKVKKLDGFGALLDRVVKAGANEVQGIQFGLQNEQAVLDVAREKAVREAQRKAAQLAKLAGAELGQVLVIEEEGAEQPPIIMERRMAMKAEAAEVPVEPGQLESQVRVQVTWALR